MDQNDGHDGGDANEQFHRNEAISAVVDEGFLGEDDDDYEDLYNDVNVGEGFLQSLRKNEDLGFRNEEEVQKKTEPVPQPVHHPQPVDDAGGGERKFENNDGVSSRVEMNSNADLGVDDMSGRGTTPPVGGGLKVELGQTFDKTGEIENRNLNNNHSMMNVGMEQQQQQQPHHVGTVGVAGNVNGGFGNGGGGSMAGSGGGGTVLFVGDLHWWTTDAELESELCKYGHVKEVKFFDEKASGKSKGYCQVEFYDPSAATACKEGMNGHVFNGRPCVVAYASPYSVKRMGEAQVNRNQQMAQSGVAKAARAPGDPPAKTGGSNMSAGGGGDNNRGFGRGNWGRGNGQGMAGRAPGGRSGMGGRSMNGFGPPPMMHPRSMMGQGFDPSFGGRMGGFPGGPAPPFPGMLPSFPPVGNVGLPGLAPHVNPAFFGRGMPMGMMPGGPNMGMWADPSMSGWAADEHGGRVGESSYGEEAVSDQQYRESSQDREQPGYERDLPREKDIVNENEWPERRHHDERDGGKDRERARERDSHRERDRDRGRDRHRDERERYGDHHNSHSHRYRDVEPEYDDEWDRGRSSRAHGKSRMSHEDEHRSRSRDADYGKRRRVTAE